jgi:hypothetical protein
MTGTKKAAPASKRSPKKAAAPATTKKRPPGRPPFEPTPEQRKLVEQLCAFGVNQTDICNFVLDVRGKPISQDTLAAKFRRELDTGEVKANSKVAQSLFHQATIEKNVTAMIFWLKTRARWRETDRLEVTGKDGGPVETKHVKDMKEMTDAELEAIIRAGRSRTSPSS